MIMQRIKSKTEKKMSATMVDQRQKIKNWKKTHQLKRPKSGTQKTKLGPKYKSLKITYLYFFFWKCYFGHTALVYTFLWTLSEFSFILDFLAESLEAIKNQQKRSLILQYSFAQKTSLILRTSTLLPLKIICSPTQPTQELLSWSTLKANACLFLHISLITFLFQRRSKIVSVSMGGVGEGYIISLRQLAVLVS